MSKEQGSESTVSGSQFMKEEEMAEEKEAPKKVSRREFVKGAAAVAGAGALASCAPAATPAPTSPTAEECAPCAVAGVPEAWDEEADVVVCGYGTGGIPAAIEAIDAGADVLCIEKCDWLGGSMRRCLGTIFGGPTVVQEAAGIEDSADAVYEYIMACGEGHLDPALMRVWADMCGPTVDWFFEELGADMGEWKLVSTLEDQNPTGPGLKYSHNSFEKYGLPIVARAHTVKAVDDPGVPLYYDGKDGRRPPEMSAGTGIFKAFNDSAQARGVRTMTLTPLMALVTNCDGEVLGVKALSGGEPIREDFLIAGSQPAEVITGWTGGKEIYIKAKRGVVLSTGGWIHNEKMMKDYIPEYPDVAAKSSKHPDNTRGEGVLAGHAIGADLSIMGYPGGNPNGGLRINTKAQVINVFGEVIPRLYAAGFTAGGLYWGDISGGGQISAGVCFGRIAGQNAAAETSWA